MDSIAELRASLGGAMDSGDPTMSMADRLCHACVDLLDVDGAAISLMLVSKAIAAIEGRDFLIPDDVKIAAPPILRHRMLLKPEADLEGITPDQIVAEVLAGTSVPQ